MDRLELEDLVYSYPAYNQAGFQTLISSKEEIRETGSGMTEPVPRRGQLFKHQKYLQRLMRQYDNQLIIWRTGTGKSCGVISVTEYYKTLIGALEDLRQDSTIPYKHVYVLVKGPSLVQEFKNQLICKCTDGDYLTDGIVNSVTARQRKNNITRSIGTFYTVKTYGWFANLALSMSDDQLKQEYGHSIFIVDEVHNLAIDSSKGKEIIDPESGNKVVVRRKKNKDGTYEEVVIDKRLAYDQLHRAFHLLKPRKVMLLSATPMINDSKEIGPLLNLLLPLNQQLPSNVDYNLLTLEQFEPYLRGMISYVRELDTGAIAKYQGEMLNATYEIGEQVVRSQMIIYATMMSPHQEKTYNVSVNNPGLLRPDITDPKKRPEAFLYLRRQASNFVFPDGTTGPYGFRKYIKKEDGKYTAGDLAPYLRDPEQLRILSSIFSEIIRLVKYTPGNAWCYSHDVIGSGAITLSLCFEYQGFEKFSQTTSIFIGEGGAKMPPVCEPENKTGRRIYIEKKLRYALLTSEVPPDEQATILETFNSYENRHGEYIKAVIGSPQSRDGLNLANVLQIHLVGPGWNQASTYQAESRAIRSTSHVDLIAEERERLKLRGENPNNAFVEIRVYRHAATTSTGGSVDLEMYQLSEVKDREIKRIMRMMKQVSTDCQIHYNRNVRAGDEDGSATCDYDVCKYKCFDPAPTEIDYSSYDVLYTGDIVSEIIEDIKKLFMVVFKIQITDLYKEFPNYRNKFIDLAVTEIITRKMPVIDRYGYTSYVREDGGSLFLLRDFPLLTIENKDNYDLSVYTEELIGIQKMNLNRYITDLQKNEQQTFLEKLLTMNPESAEFNKLIEELNIDSKVDLLESSIYQMFVNKKGSAVMTAIIKKFLTSTFQVQEPIAAINITAQALANRGKGRGRKPKDGSKFKLTEQQQIELEKAPVQEGAETIYYHILFSQSFDRTSYSVSSKSGKAEGRIRLLKPSEGVGWRDANPYELPVYNSITQKQLKGLINNFEEYDIYGMILGADKYFRIRDKTDERPGDDGRNKKRGFICKNHSTAGLIEILWKLGINLPGYKTDNITETRVGLIDYLKRAGLKNKDVVLEDFDDNKLKFYYVWIRTGMNRVQICNIIQQEMQKMGRLLIM